MQPRELDPTSSMAAYFGSELRQYREGAGWSQEQLGTFIGYSADLVGMVEKARRTPSKDFAERCDEAFKLPGVLARIWPMVGSFPNWFRGYVELEATATGIQRFEIQTVPGLLQTADYARALFRAYGADDIDAKVTARLERQEILARANPPVLWVVLDEAVLHRPIGGAEVMRAQLKRLAGLASRRIVLQVLPYAVGEHACTDGAMTILAFGEGPHVVYLEAPGSGQLVTDPYDVAEIQLRYDLVRAAALSPEASVDLIRTMTEET